MEATAMKAIIDAADNAYIIRMYEKEGVLADIYVVDEIEVSGEYLNKMTEFRSNVAEIAPCRLA